MELQNQEPQHTQPTQQSSAESTSPLGLTAARCQARNRNGSRCRLRAQHPGAPLCRRHADRAGTFADTLDDSLDLFEEVFAQQDGAYDSTESINCILTNVVQLVARGRISTRRAAVITYALSLMLRSAVVADRQAANAPPEIIWDAPRPKRDDDQPTANAPEQRKETDMDLRPHT